MRPSIKFCGLTNAADAAVAAEVGGRFVGVVFAGGPRVVSVGLASGVLGGGGPSVLRVGVFGHADPMQVAAVAAGAGLDVIQLHGDPSAADVIAVRAESGRKVWGVLRIEGGVLPAYAGEMFSVADAVLVERRVDGVPGGSGVALDWSNLARELEAVRRGGRLVLAGGLNPANVAEAITALQPDVVDVSSGVERSAGMKDHDLMKRFAEAVWGLN